MQTGSAGSESVYSGGESETRCADTANRSCFRRTYEKHAEGKDLSVSQLISRQGDVFARRWYSVQKGKCENRVLVPLDDTTIYKHLKL